MEKKTILIADDEPSVRLTLRKILDKDYNIVEATNGQEALDIARGQRLDLILMDLMMPKMDGYTACSKLKADLTTKPVPVIMLTAVGHELNKKYAAEMGAVGYVTKPFTIQELTAAITPHLAKAA